MANMYPDSLKGGVSQGEKDIFALLQSLDDSFDVYHNPTIKAKQPDFVVILNDSLLVIEVKGWRINDIVSANPKTITIKKDGKNEEQKHPLEQARGYKFDLLNFLKDTDRANNKMIDESGRLKCPIHHMVVLSNITKKQAEEKGLTEIFENDTTLFRDELKELLEKIISSEDLIKILQRFFQKNLNFGEKLANEDKKYLKALIHPEIVVSYQEDHIQILDEEQTKVAMKLGGGHRLIRGVAGSGKTIILLAKAKMIANNPSLRILFICYNKNLSENYLKPMLKDYPNITVSAFHSFVMRNHNLKPEDNDFGVKFDSKLESFLENIPENKKFDAIFIDEVQDFKPIWIKYLLHCQKDEFDGDFFIAGDNAQSLYYKGEDTKTFSDIGIDIRGRTTVLKRSYRTSKQIMALANKIIYEKGKGFFENLSPDKDENYEYILDGASPEILEVEKPYELANSLLENKYDMILIFSNKEKEKLNFQNINTFNSSKGMQWKNLLVIIDNYDYHTNSEYSENYKKALYVALTRSMAKLTIIVNQSNSKGFLALTK